MTVALNPIHHLPNNPPQVQNHQEARRSSLIKAKAHKVKVIPNNQRLERRMISLLSINSTINTKRTTKSKENSEMFPAQKKMSLYLIGNHERVISS